MGTAVVCNLALFAITVMISLTEGAPSDARYLALTLLMLFVPILNIGLLARQRKKPGVPGTAEDRPRVTAAITRGVMLCNLVLFGAVCWETVARYPYPEGNSVLAFAALAAGAPILSVLALHRGGRRATP